MKRYELKVSKLGKYDILKDGNTMFIKDVVKDLNYYQSYFENKINPLEKTLRDEIAIEAMKKFLCSDTMDADEIVDASYEYADKMLERRQE